MPFAKGERKKSARTAALPPGGWKLISKSPLIYSQICPPKRGAKRRARRLIQYGGVCWTKSEPILNEIPTDCRPAGGRTKTERSGGQKERGLESECPPGIFARPRFRHFFFRRRNFSYFAERNPLPKETIPKNSLC